MLLMGLYFSIFFIFLPQKCPSPQLRHCWVASILNDPLISFHCSAPHFQTHQQEKKEPTFWHFEPQKKQWSFGTRWCVLRTRTGAWRHTSSSRGRASTSLRTALVHTLSFLVPPSGNQTSTISEPLTSTCSMTYAEKTLNCIL